MCSAHLPLGHRTCYLTLIYFYIHIYMYVYILLCKSDSIFPSLQVPTPTCSRTISSLLVEAIKSCEIRKLKDRGSRVKRTIHSYCAINKHSELSILLGFPLILGPFSSRSTRAPNLRIAVRVSGRGEKLLITSPLGASTLRRNRHVCDKPSD